MTLEAAYNITNRHIEKAIADERRATQQINAALDRGLAIMRSLLNQNYSTFLDTGSLSLTADAIASYMGAALRLIPTQQTGQYQDLFQSLLDDSGAHGLEAAERSMIALVGSYEGEPTKVGLQTHAEDAARRLQGHIADYRVSAIATISLAVQQRWGEQRVNNQLSIGVGKLKGKAQNIAATESSYGFDTAMFGAMVLALPEKQPKRWIWNVSWSERTCSLCMARDGNVYNDGDLIMPAHGRCRCFRILYSPRWDDRQYLRDRHSNGLNALADAGLAPDYGLTSFERGAGMRKAPRPYRRASGKV